MNYVNIDLYNSFLEEGIEINWFIVALKRYGKSSVELSNS